MNAKERAIAARAASLLLRYPDAEVLGAVPTLRTALDALPDAVAERLRLVAEHRTAGDPTELASEYVQLFDFRRRCCLHLTYYSCGDTRARGEALVTFAAAYREAGFEVADGELPDFLPAVLDLAVAVEAGAADTAGTADASGPEAGWRLLRENRVGIDLLAHALEAEGSVYRHAVEAIRVLLPPPGPAELAAAAGLARTGPPREEVGLDPYPALGGRR